MQMDAGEFTRALDGVSRGISDPVAKLRFIRASLSRYRSMDRWVRRVPGERARRILYRWLSLEGLRHLLSSNPLGAPVRMDRRTRLSLVLGRAATVLTTLAVLGALGGLAGVAYRFWRPEARPVLAAAERPRLDNPPPGFLPDGVAPAAVWLVEQGPDWEQHSNGLRVDTTFAVEGEPRRYHVFAVDAGRLDAVQNAPVGILFHTSESDIWPLEASFNEELRHSTRRLLRYVQKHRLYHYLIDRFGRVYRVVAEETKANHAGHGVWADGKRLHLNLNHAFLGLSFETRWEGGKALPITQAQFAAGRNLTDYLRGRWRIAPEMCVAHGLTSVNPRRHLIGHHLDWARGFPFEAFGLPDQYRRPAPSVAVFGFGYDRDFLKVLGEPWAGVREAERALIRQAARQGRPVDELRRQRQGLYDRWLAEQAGEEAVASAPGSTGQPPAVPARSGG